jgi:iron(III) transport system substrate-binding protein
VWWSSEPFGTIELARAGVLAPCESPAAADIPAEWKDARRRWTGLAARARVIAYNTQRVRPDELPSTWRDFASENWASRATLANPQFGTTRGHVAAMFASWGATEATAFLTELHEAGTRIADGNSMALQAVASGGADLCMTDTDDVWVFQQRGAPVEMIYPSMTADPQGPTLWIPCTVALVKGAPNEETARRLIDYLVSAEVEQALAASDSRNVPVRGALRAKLRFETPEPVAPRFEKIVDAMPDAMLAARELLLR